MNLGAVPGRPFVVGLSDEAGAGANVGLAIKTQFSPTKEEAARVDEYIQKTLWGIKQDIPYPTSLQVSQEDEPRISS